ncbi:carbonic anhydrase [Paenibacillus pini JCM 16418]|uniref:Carbonic anhydrase n=1 Tax=Paenibacillus pini JCM 16418 TaxID=1236976 RepID=W7YNA4_9BACL|nr:carbonic anhydrase [Paenibacillus pini JCM 16418]
MLIKYYEQMPRIHSSVYMAEGAKIIGDVQVGEESSIWFNAVLRGDMAPILIGNRCNIQDGPLVTLIRISRSFSLMKYRLDTLLLSTDVR